MSQIDWSKDDVFGMLFTAVGSGNINKTKEILNTHSKLADLSDHEINEDGMLFGIAIKNSSEMLKLLVDIYVQTKLQGNPHSMEYLAAKIKLGNMLEEQIDSSPYEFDELDEEIQEILRPWLPEDVDSEVDERDLGDLDDVLEFVPSYSSEHNGHEMKTPEFCGWPEALSHHSRHFSGDAGVDFGNTVH
jgi:hypothetical protein